MLPWHSPWITIAEQTKVTEHRAKCDRFGCQFRPIYATKSKIFDLKVGQNSQRSAHKHSTSVKKKYSWFRKSNFHDQKSVRIYTIKDSKLSFSCPKFILTIHLVVGVFSLWLLIGQPQLHTKWFIYWQVTLCHVLHIRKVCLQFLHLEMTVFCCLFS